MSSLKFSRGAAAWALGAWLVACSKPVPPRVTPLSASVVGVDPSGLRLKIELDVYNPNSFPILARAVDGTVSVGSGTPLGRGHAEPNGSIGSEQSGTLTSELIVSWQNLAALAPFALSTASVPYTFDGQATIGGEKLNVSIPFQVKGLLSRADLVKIGIAGLPNLGVPNTSLPSIPNLGIPPAPPVNP